MTTRTRWATQVCMLVLLTNMYSGCRPNGREFWKEVASKCATSDLFSRSVIYFGPSTRTGPGTLFKLNADGKGYDLRLSFEKFPNMDPTTISPGVTFQCSGKSVTGSSIDPSIALKSDFAPVNGTASGAFSKAKTVTFSARSMQWVNLEPLLYESYLAKLPADGAIRRDIARGDRFVILRALEVTGASATLQFDSSVAVDLETTLKDGQVIPINTGDIGVSMKAKWTNSTTLELTSEESFFLGGELGKLDPTGKFQSAGAANPKPIIPEEPVHFGVDLLVAP